MPPERELNRFVDEDDDAKGDDKDNICGVQVDLDEVCGYTSPKMVRIKDKIIGQIYWGIVTAIIMYTVIWAFYMEGKGMITGAGIGTVITGFKGKAFSTTGKVFDAADLRYPVLEPSGAFIMTKRIVVKDQQMGVCVDEDGDLKEEVQTWCPSLGHGNADSPPDGAVIDVIEGLENAVLTIKSGISFPTLEPGHQFVAGTSEGGTTMYENITLGKLLSLATPPITLADVTERGAVLSVAFYWSCSMGSDCEPSVVIERLDEGMGFSQKRASHKRKDGAEVRDATIMYGVRILVDSSGTGRSLNFASVVIQLGSCLSLMRIATYCADGLMLGGCFGASRTAAYRKCRVMDTEDASDRKAQIGDVKKEREKRKQRDEERRNQLRSRGPGTQD